MPMGHTYSVKCTKWQVPISGFKDRYWLLVLGQGQLSKHHLQLPDTTGPQTGPLYPEASYPTARRTGFNLFNTTHTTRVSQVALRQQPEEGARHIPLGAAAATGRRVGARGGGAVSAGGRAGGVRRGRAGRHRVCPAGRRRTGGLRRSEQLPDTTDTLLTPLGT